jgi:hypothetical protein
MLNPLEAERLLDSHPLLTLDRIKEKNSAVYRTNAGRYIAFERRLKTVTKLHFEPKLDTGSIRLSEATVIEHLSPSTPRVHLPIPISGESLFLLKDFFGHPARKNRQKLRDR